MTTSSILGSIRPALMSGALAIAAMSSLLAAGEPSRSEEGGCRQPEAANTVGARSDAPADFIRPNAAGSAEQQPRSPQQLTEAFQQVRRWGQLAAAKVRQMIGCGRLLRPSTARATVPTLRLVWPEILYREYYVQHRVKIEKLLAGGSGGGAGNGKEIQQTIAQMKSKLRGQIKEANSPEYLAAQKYLDNLAVEASSVVRPTANMVVRK